MCLCANDNYYFLLLFLALLILEVNGKDKTFDLNALSRLKLQDLRDIVVMSHCVSMDSAYFSICLSFFPACISVCMSVHPFASLSLSLMSFSL